MAIALQGKTNVQAPGGSYPYGRIKDNPGDGSGTPVNLEVYGDFHQFFARLLDQAGVTANGQFDNSSNGFQYMDALYSVINKIAAGDWIVVGSGGGAPAFGTGVTAYTGSGDIRSLSFRKEGNTVRISGGFECGNPGSPPWTAFTLPVGFRPSKTIAKTIYHPDSGTYSQIGIGSDGVFGGLANGTFNVDFTIPLG